MASRHLPAVPSAHAVAHVDDNDRVVRQDGGLGGGTGEEGPGEGQRQQRTQQPPQDQQQDLAQAEAARLGAVGTVEQGDPPEGQGARPLAVEQMDGHGDGDAGETGQEQSVQEGHQISRWRAAR